MQTTAADANVRLRRFNQRGQICPGYLLAINKAVAQLAPGTPARLLISYPPCGEDVVHWCREREIEYLGTSSENGLWTIRIRK